MPSVFLYIIKLSLSLAVVYTFYQFVLRRLTFYNWNRFYLIVYTALSFFIPFVNITPVLERNEMLDNRAVQFIPSVNTFNSIDPVVQFQSERSVSFSTWDWVLLCIAAGVIIMLVRLFVQLISFKRIINKARLLSDDNVKLYQVDQPVIPFSFGNSIFLNQHQHSESELHEIVRHEFVHIKQKHTVDILWSELLCIFNWYNPFAWLIRKSIRQNLEFIADNKVLQSGIDRRQYQYLLLKVTGNNHFSIASQFNFSSLKKRIAMMNKMKSARVHLLKFLFMLPLGAVLILSFRNNKTEKIIDEDTVTVSGIVYDSESKIPLKAALVEDRDNGVKALSDENGFYSIKLPITENNNGHFLVNISKQGYKNSMDGFSVRDGFRNSSVILIGIPNENSQRDGSSINNVRPVDQNGNAVLNPGYSFVKQKFDASLERERLHAKIDKMVGNSEKPIWIIDGIPYAIGNDMKAWFDKDDLEKSPEFRVWVDGKIMTMDEVNRNIKKSSIRGVGASTIDNSKKYFNVNYNLLILEITKTIADEKNTDGSGKIQVSSRISSDTVPSVQTIALSRDDKMDDAHKTFFTKNKNVKLLYWKNDLNTLEVYLNNGSVDEYDLRNKESILVGESKYGPLPSPAMGSYRVFTNKGNSLVLKGSSGNYTVVVGDNNFREIAKVPLDDWNKKKSYYENLYGEMPPILKMLTESKATDVTLDGPSKQYDAGFFKSDKQPLVIVDGVEQPENTDPSSLLQPADIAEMKVFKAGSATGEYGYKGRNGVIAITTRAYAARDVEETVSTTTAAGINEEPVVATTTSVSTATVKPTAVMTTGKTIKGAPEKVSAATVETIGTTVPTKEVSATIDPKRVTGKTVAPEKTNAATIEKIGTTVPAKEVSATVDPKRVAGETVSPVKEIKTNKNILALIKSKTTDAELRKIEKDLKVKGYVFRAVRTEYKDGKLILISGTISKANVEGGQAFTASDFSQVIISEDPDEDGNLFNFRVESGKLSVFNAN